MMYILHVYTIVFIQSGYGGLLFIYNIIICSQCMGFPPFDPKKIEFLDKYRYFDKKNI